MCQRTTRISKTVNSLKRILACGLSYKEAFGSGGKSFFVKVLMH
jgi:hypothetical protein